MVYSQAMHTAIPQPAEALLTKKEAADRLRVTARTLERWAAAGELLPVRFGRIVRYRASDIEAFIDRAASA